MSLVSDKTLHSTTKISLSPQKKNSNVKLQITAIRLHAHIRRVCILLLLLLIIIIIIIIIN